MTEQYLLIQNPGVCPIEGFTVFGLSSSRSSAEEGVIGQFGSGSKHATNLLLRQGVNPVIYLGHKKLCFFTKPDVMKDELGEVRYNRVYLNVDGEVRDLNYSVDYGSLDWNNTAMALREYVSNAIDRTIKGHGNFTHPELTIDIVCDPTSKGDCTRVFIPLTCEVQRFFMELHQWFLHFSSDPEKAKIPVLRQEEERRKGRLYRVGAFVRETRIPAVFDYNFDKTLKIDESRNLSDYFAQEYAAQWLFTRASGEDLEHFFQTLIRGEKTFEADFPSYSMPNTTAAKSKVLAAWNNVAAGRVLIQPFPFIEEYCRKKGYSTVCVDNDAWVTMLIKAGAKSFKDVLTEDERNGLETFPPTGDMLAVLDEVWVNLTRLNLDTKPKPKIVQYSTHCDAGCTELGTVRDDTVLISTKIASGRSEMLYETVLEEVTHYLTGAGDCSRDIQEFLFTLIIKEWRLGR